MISNLLTEYRKKASLTQKQVGESIGISAQAVSKWENGQSEPDIDTLCKLAELYGVSVNTLIGKEDTLEQASTVPTEAPAPAPAKSSKKKIILILAISLVAVAVITIACILLFGKGNHTETPATLLEKYEQISLGMTMDEVRAIFGEADHTHAEYLKGTSPLGSKWEEAMSLSSYGYYNADFWYYYSQEYYDNEDALNEAFTSNPNLKYEMKNYTKIRITFKDGVVIEAYYHPDIEYNFYADDYDCKVDKTVSTVTYFGEVKLNTENDVKITYADGSIFLGKLSISKNWQNKYTAEFPELGKHPWGAISYTDSQIVASITE